MAQFSKYLGSLYSSISKQTNNSIKKWKDLNTHFSKEDIQMANRHIKRCSTSLIIREMQSKTNEVLPRIGQNDHHQKVYNTKRWTGCGDKETLRHCW